MGVEIEHEQIPAPTDAGQIGYTPAVLADWDGAADPGDVDGALDQLGARAPIVVASLPGSAADGRVVYLTTDQHLYVYQT